MATIKNKGFTKTEEFIRELRTMDDSQLVAQQLIQQGAVHAVAWLLRHGPNEQTATSMLASLRENMGLVREEANRRGLVNLFIDDQTGFN